MITFELKRNYRDIWNHLKNSNGRYFKIRVYVGTVNTVQYIYTITAELEFRDCFNRDPHTVEIT